MMAIALLACIATMAATAKKTNLKILYVGGHSDIETLGVADYDKEAHAKRFLRHNQIFEQFFVLINTKEVFWNIQALQYR